MKALTDGKGNAGALVFRDLADCNNVSTGRFSLNHARLPLCHHNHCSTIVPIQIYAVREYLILALIKISGVNIRKPSVKDDAQRHFLKVKHIILILKHNINSQFV